MFATSPVRHEPPTNVQLAPIEVLQCQAPPWKALSDFALQRELDQPPFEQLVSSFGESSGDDDDDTVVCVDEPKSSRSHHQSLRPGTATLYSSRSATSHRHRNSQLASQVISTRTTVL